MPQDVNESIYSAKYFLITFWVISHWKQTVHVKKLQESLRPSRLAWPHLSHLSSSFKRESQTSLFLLLSFYFDLPNATAQLSFERDRQSSKHLSLDERQNIGAQRHLSGQLIGRCFIYWSGKLGAVKVTNFDMGCPALMNSSLINHWESKPFLSPLLAIINTIP